MNLEQRIKPVEMQRVKYERQSMNTVVIFGDLVITPQSGLRQVDCDLPDPILDALSQLYWSERDPAACGS
jgi:hypothetical protein